MTALAASAKPDTLGRVYEPYMSFLVAATTKIWQGGLVAIKSDGYVIPAGLAAGGSVRVVGFADEEVDNLLGTAGAKRIRVRRGVLMLANSSAGDLIVEADRGAAVYVVDDATVAKTDASATRIKAGIFEFFERGKPMVRVGVDFT